MKNLRGCNKNKIGIIGIRGLPANYGAFDTFVDQLVNSDEAKDKDYFFYVSCETEYKNQIYIKDNVERIFVHRGKGLLILINYFLNIVLMLKKGVNVFVFFGYGAAIFFPLLKLLKKKVICNPDGIEWRRPESYLKKIYFKFCENIISKQDIVRIYDSNVIRRYYKIIHKADGYVAYYPSIFENFSYHKNYKSDKDEFYLIGRLLQENNTELIVKAFEAASNNQHLYIIGKQNNYFNKKILPIINSCKNITYLGPIYDKQKLFDTCSKFEYYVHGHSVGGTNPTLIEAISLNKKIISFKTFFNKEVLGQNGLYFKNLAELNKILENQEYRDIAQTSEYIDVFKAKFINNYYLSHLKSQ